MKKRILIVEDERNIGRGLEFNCAAEGYAVTLVGDGPSALKLFEPNADAFELVILDLMLPGMSGYAVLERLRCLNPYIPVLILSARTLAEDRVRGFDLGADQYMMKPFDLNELLSRVRNLLSRKLPARPTEPAMESYEFNGAVVNFVRHEATVRGEAKSLTPLEFDLLKCFFTNEGAVLTRSQLLDNVWGVDSSPTTRTVDNFIVRLRRHFEMDPARPQHFLSVRGVGYRFVREAAANTPPEEDDADVAEPP